MTYKRADGVQLSFTLYLPPDYKGARGCRRWSGPTRCEFNDADTAGQVAGSPQRFTSVTGSSQLFFLLHGYAVLDSAAMPVVGDPGDREQHVHRADRRQREGGHRQGRARWA